MKKTTLLSLFCFSSANAWTPPLHLLQNTNNDPASNNFLSPLSSSSQSHQMNPNSSKVTGSDDQSFARLGDGYRTMATEFTVGTLFQNLKSSLVPSSGSDSISFQDDLSEEQLRREMGLKVSGTIPVEEVVVSPAVNFSRKASKTRLSRTTTLIQNVRLGTYKAKANQDQAFVVANSALRFFDENGLLKKENFGEFYKFYGDSVVVSQELVGKLFVTIKLSFDSSTVLNEFNAKVGGSISSLLTNESKDDEGSGKIIEFNVKLTALSEDIKKHTSLTLVATQFGGRPQNLAELFNTPSTCSLSNLGPCQSVIDKLNQYVSRGFKSQLKPQDPSTWYAERLTVAPYDSLNLMTQDGFHLYFQSPLDALSNVYFKELVNKVSRVILKEVKAHNTAVDMLRVDNLARNEYEQAENALYASENNYQKLKGFADFCYQDLQYCFANQDAILNTLVTTYPTNLLNTNLGTFVTQVNSSYMPLNGQKHRSSENFMQPENLLHSERYSNFYFKLKTVENDLVTNNNIKFDVTCDVPWYRGYDQDVMTGIFSGSVVLNDTFHSTFIDLCMYDDSIYIRNPVGFPYPGLTVEIWGRE